MTERLSVSFSQSDSDDNNKLPSGQGQPPEGYDPCAIQPPREVDWSCFTRSEEFDQFDCLSDDYVNPNSSKFGKFMFFVLYFFVFGVCVI